MPVSRGVHTVKVYMAWLWRYGEAEIVVDNREGPDPIVHWAVPWRYWGPGAIGLRPVKNPGFGAFLVIMAVLLTALFGYAIVASSGG